MNHNVEYFPQFILESISIMTFILMINISMIVPTFVFGCLLYGALNVYISTSKNINRVESITRSPVLTHVNATLQGLSTIRAFQAEESVKLNFNTHMDHNTSVSESIRI
jgi:ATP-binding cassette, subfamily C (CFTR/MRP), member 4